MRKLVFTFYVILSVMLLASCDLGGLFGSISGSVSDALNPDKCAKGHDYVESVIVPTCTEGGYSTFKCTRCEDSYVDNEIEARGHNYVSVVTPPSCGAAGFTTNTCSACGDEYESDPADALIHRFNDSACKNCGAEENKEVITPDTEWYDATVMVLYIDTAEKLAGLAEIVNSGTDISRQSFRMSADIDLGYAEWIPIGTTEHPFNAIFDGNNHTIYGLKICASGSYAGLFGKSSGTISNLSVLDATIYAKSAPEYLGILCGYSENKIENVTVSGYLDAEYSAYVGGIVGYSNAGITDSTSNATICGGSYVGGVCGTITINSNTAYSNLVNNGKVSGGNYTGGICGSATTKIGCIYSDLANHGEISGGSYTGGVIGYAVSEGLLHTIEVANTGNVTGKDHTGGIYGYAKGKVGSLIEDSSSSSAISGAYFVGAIIGKGDGVGLSDCDNFGSTVTATSYSVSGDQFYAYLGGYAGYAESVSGCVNTVDISYIFKGNCVGGVAGYVKGDISGCENTASVVGADMVGGIVGMVDAANAINTSTVKNSGSVSGNSYVGGIAGKLTSANAITIGHIENRGTIVGKAYVGGIIGEIPNKSVPVSISDVTNTGALNGGHHIGGLFGYIGGSTVSYIRECTSSADIIGTYYVGGLVGVAYDVAIQDCSNEGSSVSATDWVVSGEYTDVYLGGYVGLGYKVSDCVNNVEINYTGIGRFVGGIAGCVESEIKNCENNADIISAGNLVGGIAGELSSVRYHALTYSTLTNNGNIEGNSYVGGITGYMYQSVSVKGTQVQKKDYNHYYTIDTKIDGLVNKGRVKANSSAAGGIIGCVHLENSYSGSNYGCCRVTTSCSYHGVTRLLATKLENYGAVSGVAQVGEIYGSCSVEWDSTVTTYTVIGSVTVNGTVVDGGRDVGVGSKITLTGKTLAEVDAEEDTEENTEDTPVE